MRFRKVLETALSVPIYESSLRLARIDRRTLNRVTDIESVLAYCGVVTRDQVKVHSPRGKSTTVVTSPLPIAAALDLSWNNEGCAALQEGTGPRRICRGLLMRTGLEEGLLSPMDRDGLWQRHGVPMFEHLVGLDGELLAWECETHSGLHIMEENVVFEHIQGEVLMTSLTVLVRPTIQMRTGWSARIETEPCDCGRPGRRLMGLRELAPHAALRHRDNRRAVAAHA